MSLFQCDVCHDIIDTDDDPECFEFREDKCVCESCREEMRDSEDDDTIELPPGDSP